MSPPSLALALGALIACVCLASASSVTDIDELDLQRQQPPRQQLAPGSPRSPVANDVIAIKEGADLDLSCPIVITNEDMIISWTCDNEPANIRSSRIHVTDNGKLRIRSSKVGDSCNYRCEVADGHGALSVIIKVIIVDQRLMDELTRRATLAGSSFLPSSLQTVNETNTTTSGETVAPTKKRIIGKQQRENRAHPAPVPLTTGAPISIVGNNKQEHDPEIEMQIEPAEITVDRNKTFSLECRIKHSPRRTVSTPQIVWLKEYMGAPIESINEALDKSLIYLDGVYYHSLNWPRAITYSNNSSSASSALLIRHSNFMHSGRYVCFAGYPSSVMSLGHSNSMRSAQTAVAADGNGPAAPSVLAHSRSPPLSYRIAAARVRVDDDAGESSYLTSLAWASTQAKGGHKSEQLARAKPTAASHVFVSVVSTNTWQRNLTLLLLLGCGSMALVKLAMVMRHRARKSRPGQHVAMINDDVDADSPLPPPPAHKSVANLARPAAAATAASVGRAGGRTGSDSLLSGLPHVMPAQETCRDRFSDVPANSLIAGNNPLRDEYRIDQELLNERLSGIDTSNNNSEHVYSEIGSNNTNNNHNHNNNLTVPKSVLSEPYYKLPNKNV